LRLGFNSGAIIGTSDVGSSKPFDGLKFVLRNVVEGLGLLERSGEKNDHYRLTFPGWQRYEELKTQTTTSRSAFIAMSFRNPDVGRAYADCFQPAVKATGFELRTVNDPSQAGLIDLRIEVGIRNAKFVIADLTDGNNGAYWEAGFAHGLGKEVFYTCEKSRFTPEHVHFDAIHRHAVLWEIADLARAQRDLSTVIRATLPKDAKLDDDVEDEPAAQ
jgi:hypothetical protein